MNTLCDQIHIVLVIFSDTVLTIFFKVSSCPTLLTHRVRNSMTFMLNICLDVVKKWMGEARSYLWLRVDMLDLYTVLGLTLVSPTNVVKYHLNYPYIDRNVTVNYLANEDYTTYWYENPAQGRYWMIEPLEYVSSRPQLKGDIIGYL